MESKKESVFHKKGKWRVIREGSNKTSKLFKTKKDAMKYASIIASKDGSSVVENFKYGNEIYVEPHKIGPIITGTIEIAHPIVNNTEPVIQKINLN